jgi:O-acetyl-ADP-ribose deacetylase (regulator of RNase III)
MIPIEYRRGNLFDVVPDGLMDDHVAFICHVCNDCGAWGAGFVLALNEHYPQAKKEYLKWYSGGEITTVVMPLELGITQFVNAAPNVVICNMIAQHGIGHTRPLRYNALASCMDHVARVMEASKLCRDTKSAIIDLKKVDHQPEIHAPFFGAGLAGGDWNFIEQLIIDCWSSRDIRVIIHCLDGKKPSGWAGRI